MYTVVHCSLFVDEIHCALGTSVLTWCRCCCAFVFYANLTRGQQPTRKLYIHYYSFAKFDTNSMMNLFMYSSILMIVLYTLFHCTLIPNWPSLSKGSNLKMFVMKKIYMFYCPKTSFKTCFEGPKVVLSGFWRGKFPKLICKLHLMHLYIKLTCLCLPWKSFHPEEIF